MEYRNLNLVPVSNEGIQAIKRLKRDEPPAHYTLKINSFFKLCEIVRNDDHGKYESGEFEVGGYKWKMWLYPAGNLEENGFNHISLYLALADTNSIPPGCYIDVILKFFVYNQSQDKYLTIQDGRVKRYHALKTVHGFDQLLLLKTFTDNGYLVNGCCAFGAEVHLINCTGKGEELSFMEQPQDGSYTWKVESFSTLDKDYIESKIFTAAGFEWSLTLHPKGESMKKDSISLYLTLEDEGILSEERVFVNYKLSIKDQVFGRHHHCIGSAWLSADGNYSWGHCDFMRLSDLHNASNGYLVNNILIVEAEITVVCAAKPFS